MLKFTIAWEVEYSLQICPIFYEFSIGCNVYEISKFLNFNEDPSGVMTKFCLLEFIVNRRKIQLRPDFSKHFCQLESMILRILFCDNFRCSNWSRMRLNINVRSYRAYEFLFIYTNST